MGDIRGRGLFWGVEFVQDKVSKEPFPLDQRVASAVHLRALKKGVATYQGVGTADGVRGDHVLLAPPYTVAEEDIDVLVRILGEVLREVFENS